MLQKYKKSLFIFHRDLRLDDNTGLLQAQEFSKIVIPCFIIDVEQVTSKNKFRSSNALEFMVASLHDLEKQLQKKAGKLFIFYGDPAHVVRGLIAQEKIDAVFANHDYTPFSTARDHAIERVCKTLKIDYVSCSDLLLNEPDAVLKKDKKPYTIFTPFFNCAHKIQVREPIKNHAKNFYNHAIGIHEKSWESLIDFTPNTSIFATGGRRAALKILTHLEKYKQYAQERDFPARESTTGLAAHLKFGTCSVREVFHAIKKNLGLAHPLIRQLYWRDFFTHIACNFPHVFGHAFHKKYDKLPWVNDKKLFKSWCEGKTGFPIVDAGMRQLNQTGFMHNRVRMIVASFLVKDLHGDWRLGERYFAQKLVDYDPAVNNGNWQWAASTGCDAQPYFRIFNPWLQQKKFDPECLYIKKWVPELENVPIKQIHTWFSLKAKPGDLELAGVYPKPIVCHEHESRLAKQIYKRL